MTDKSLLSDQQVDMCACCTCGYRWQRGKDGSHSCTSALLARVSALEGALRPFARFSSGFGRTARDDDWVLVKSPSGMRTITMGDVRAAEDVLRAPR